MSNIKNKEMEKTIVIVDDEAAVRRSLSLGLNQKGYNVESCENGTCVLNKLESLKKNENSPDTIVVDIFLPDINGIKLGNIIKSEYPDASLIYITGSIDKLDKQEIENLKSDVLLEKPFTIEDLTDQFQKIHESQEKSEFVITEVIKKVVTSTSAYMLLKLKNNADFMSIYRKLYYMENILYCDATYGDYDIILLVNAESTEECKEILKNRVGYIEDIEKIDFLPINKPLPGNNINDIMNSAGISSNESSDHKTERDFSVSMCSYIFLKVNENKLKDVNSVLSLNENVAYCDYTTGKYNLILLVYGRCFDEIDKLIENNITNLDGILKVKEYPIVNMFDM